jgi:glycosyltransferase involved in cell wall biosynthesis
VDYFGIPPARIDVIYNGVAPPFRPDLPRSERDRVAARYGLSRPYLLFLGGEKPHKNVRNVIRAFAEARRERALPHALVLAGPMPSNRSRVDALIDALDLGTRVVRTGIVPDEDLPGLFAGADAFLYPTLYEGFGLPVVEAMACGVPVLTSSTSALQEIAGGYAYLVDPMDVDSIAKGIVDLAIDPARRAEFAALGARRALEFSWDRAAEQTLRVYAETLARGPRKRTRKAPPGARPGPG